jgi:uncharacterized protein YjbI with pentapeptide repeats
VVFSESFDKSAWFGLVAKDVTFVGANLQGAQFYGAKLSWTKFEPDVSKWYEHHGTDEEGRPLLEQVHYPAFWDADLKDATFRFAELDHADFRGANDILAVDFEGAKGLETCFFDEKVRERVLAAASEKKEKQK